MTMTVSSATRVAQPISSAPATVVVLTADDIRAYGWRTLADALATIPGLYTASDRTYTYLGARGFQRPGDYNSRFLLLIDGMRVNDAVYDQAPIGADFPLDMDLVERIEYVAGPGSAVYGSNALFGVINVITKSGKDIGGAQVAAAGGSFGEKRGRATYGWHGANGADVVLSASAYEKNGQDLYYPEFDTPDQNNGIAQNLDYERAQNLFAKFAYEGFRLSVGYGNRTKGVPDAPYGAVFDTPFSVTDTHSFVDATWHQALREDVALDYELYWGRYDYRSPELDGPPPGTENMDGDHAMWYGGDVHATITTFARNRIVAGVDFTRDANRDQFNYNVAPYQLLLDDHRSSDMAGVYAEDQITLLDSLSLDLGVRYDAESNMGGNVNPRVALIYRPTSRDTFKAIYGTAYRAPNAYEMYYAVPGDGGQEGNPSLGAEHIATEELVYERAIGASGRATLSLFRYTLRDLITETTDPSTGLFVFENVDRAQAKGAELAYEQGFAGGVRVRASYSYQMSRDSGSGAALQDSPRHMGKLNAVIPLFHERGWFGGEMQCLSSRLSEFGEAGGYCIGNVTIGSRKLLDHADVSFSIYNVTDRHYSDPAGPGFIQDTIVQQSRTFLLKVVYGF